MRNLWLSSSGVSWHSQPLNDFLQHPVLCDELLQSYSSPSPTVWSALGLINMKMAHLVAIWLHWKQIPQQWYRHMQEKTHIKIMILK